MKTDNSTEPHKRNEPSPDSEQPESTPEAPLDDTQPPAREVYAYAVIPAVEGAKWPSAPTLTLTTATELTNAAGG